MQVVHTAALPPNHGRMRRAISGCTRNSRNDERKMVAAYSIASVDLARVGLIQHPRGDRVYRLRLLAPETVRSERVARPGLRRLAAHHRDQRIARREAVRPVVRRLV